MRRDPARSTDPTEPPSAGNDRARAHQPRRLHPAVEPFRGLPSTIAGPRCGPATPPVSDGSNRFKLAIIYCIVGIAVGVPDLPHQPWQVLFLGISLSLSVGFGIIRGRCTPVRAVGGRVYIQGTVLTVTLFLLLVLTKVAMGTAASLLVPQNLAGSAKFCR